MIQSGMHGRSINECRSNDCRSYECRRNNCQSNDCRSNETTPKKAYDINEYFYFLKSLIKICNYFCSGRLNIVLVIWCFILRYFISTLAILYPTITPSFCTKGHNRKLEHILLQVWQRDRTLSPSPLTFFRKKLRKSVIYSIEQIKNILSTALSTHTPLVKYIQFRPESRMLYWMQSYHAMLYITTYKKKGFHLNIPRAHKSN